MRTSRWDFPSSSASIRRSREGPSAFFAVTLHGVVDQATQSLVVGLRVHPAYLDKPSCELSVEEHVREEVGVAYRVGVSHVFHHAAQYARHVEARMADVFGRYSGGPEW